MAGHSILQLKPSGSLEPIDLAQEASLNLSWILAELGHNEAIPYPDISTKVKAQAFIGLDIMKLEAEKRTFMEQVVPEWDRKAITAGRMAGKISE